MLSCLAAQEVYWVDFSYSSPKLNSAAVQGGAIASLNLTSGSIPQGLAFDPVQGRLYLVELHYSNAKILRSTLTLAKSTVDDSIRAVLRDVAVDTLNHRLYWTTSKAGSNLIQSSNLNGTHVQTLANFATEDPGLRCLALDLDAGKMYWTEFSSNRIRRADLDGTNIETIVADLSGPTGLAILPNAQQLFWTETNANKLCRSSLTGADITTLINSGLDRPNYLTIDHRNQKIYWTEDGNAGQSIKSAYMDGSNVTTLPLTVGHPAGIVIAAEGIILARVKIFLQGFYDAQLDLMHTQLANVLPTTSPFTDNRSVSAIPANVTDWIYLRLRETPTAADYKARSAFLHKNGAIVDDDGVSDVAMPGSSRSYYLLVSHRNHLATMSSSAHSLTPQSATTTLYDFTTQLAQAYQGAGLINLEVNVFGMAAGDINQDGLLTSKDYVPWYRDFIGGTTGYRPADLSGNQAVQIDDYNIWKTNSQAGLHSEIP